MDNVMLKYGVAFLMLLSLSFAACSSEEDALEPSHAQDNFFSVPEGQNDPVSQLRRNFYNETGVHLLFNDTLRCEYGGKDGNGNDYWNVEVVDFNYNLNSYGTMSYRFELLEEQHYQECADFVREAVIDRIGGSLRPYSLLLVSSLDTRTTSSRPWTPTATISNMRCMGVSLGDIIDMTEEEKDAYKVTLLVQILSSRISIDDERLADFFSYVGEYYSDYGYAEYISDVWPDWENGDIERIREAGFFDYNDQEDSYWDTFISRTNDFSSFMEKILSMTSEQFEEAYGDYQIIMARYGVLRNILIEMGVKL